MRPSSPPCEVALSIAMHETQWLSNPINGFSMKYRSYHESASVLQDMTYLVWIVNQRVSQYGDFIS